MLISKSSKLGVLFLAAILTASCGGGGGGGGGGGNSSGGGGGNSVTFTPDRTTVSFTYNEGSGFGLSASVNVTAAGNINTTLYIGATVEGTGIDPNILASVTGTSARFDIAPRSNLEAGTYTGRILLLGCSDANCTKQIGNSPVIITYTVTVQPTLRATPSNVDATSPSGTPTSREIAVRLPVGATSFDAVVTQGSEWLSVEPMTSTSFRLRMGSLPTSNYFGSVRVSAGNSSLSVPVAYVVSTGVAYRNLSASPANFSLTGTEGALSAPATLNVTPPSWDAPTSAAVVGNANWLSVNSAAGGYSLVVDATNLTAGSYTTSVRVTGAWPSTPVEVPVAVTVGPGLKRPADVAKTIHSESTASAFTGTTLVELNAGPPSTWTAVSEAPWLVLTDSAGTTGETLSYEIDLAGFTALANDAVHEARVVITPQRSTMTPVAYYVRVNKDLARITAVAPYLQPAGKAVRVILRGSGFDAVTNLASRLRIDNGTGAITSVERVNDTELVLRLNPLSAGAHPVTINNALGLATGTQTLKTFTPTVLTYSTAPTGGVPRGLVWDQERQAALLANVTLESLQQYKFASGGWTVNSVAVPAVHSVGLTLDGSRLMVASNPGSTVYGDGTSYIRQLDPDSLAQISVKAVPQMGNGFTYIMGELHTTNDGRTWFSLGSGQWNNLAYYEASKDAMTQVQVTNIPTTFHGGPWFIVSRDGERLLMPQSGSISSNPPALYLDARDGVLHINSGGVQNSYRMSISEDGDRVLFDNYEVRDRDFALIGRVILPTSHNYFPMSGGGVMSPDGRRVYALAYHNNYGYSNPALPRLYVLDSTTRQTTQQALPILGYVEIPDYAHCTNYNDYNCTLVVQTAISPDGNNVFFAGNQKLIAMPIPAESALTPIMKAQRPQGFVTTPWPLNLGGKQAN